MGKKRIFSDIEIKEILKFYETNSLCKTCDKFHIGPPKLREILRENNVEIRDVSKGNILSHKNRNDEYKKTVSITYDDVYKYYIIEAHNYYDTIKHFNNLGIRNFVVEELLNQIHKTQEQINESKIKTNNEKFGYDWCSQNPDIALKAETNKIKSLQNTYGNNITNVFQLESTKEATINTWLNKYGVDSPMKVKEIAKRAHENGKITCQEKYGSNSYISSKEYMELRKQYYFDNYGVYGALGIPETQAKAQNTKRLNHTFNSSKPEDEYYEYLINIYGIDNVKRHYCGDPRYPFECDFYIPSEDLFIECNFHYTHGPHPFDKDNADDLKLLEYIRSKQCYLENGNKNSYYSFEDTWTRRDVEKLQYLSKLNHKVFYSLEEAFI